MIEYLDDSCLSTWADLAQAEREDADTDAAAMERQGEWEEGA